MKKLNSILNDIDRQRFLHRIQSYYDMPMCKDTKKLGKLLKIDLKCPKRMRQVIGFTDCEEEEFFIHATALFSEIFNKLTIRKIKKNLELPLDDHTRRGL